MPYLGYVGLQMVETLLHQSFEHVDISLNGMSASNRDMLKLLQEVPMETGWPHGIRGCWRAEA